MTISTTTNSAQALFDGVNDSFNFDFPVASANHVKAYFITPSGTVGDPIPEYSVQVSFDNTGGTVTLDQVYPQDGRGIFIQRETSLDQETDLQEGGLFPAESVEGAFDKLTMIVQDQNVVNQSSLHADPVNPEIDFYVNNNAIEDGYLLMVSDGFMISSPVSVPAFDNLVTQLNNYLLQLNNSYIGMLSDGVTFTRVNQYALDDNGNAWAPVSMLSLPYTTSEGDPQEINTNILQPYADVNSLSLGTYIYDAVAPIFQDSVGNTIYPQNTTLVAEVGDTVPAGTTVIHLDEGYYLLDTPIATEGDILTIDVNDGTGQISIDGTIYNLDRTSIVELTKRMAAVENIQKERTTPAVGGPFPRNIYSAQNGKDTQLNAALYGNEVAYSVGENDTVLLHNPISRVYDGDGCQILRIDSDGVIKNVGSARFTTALITAFRQQLTTLDYIGLSTRENNCLAEINGHIYIAGDSEASLIDYDPATDQTSVHADTATQTAVEGIYAAANGKIYFVPSTTNPIIYDPSNDTWGTPNFDFSNTTIYGNPEHYQGMVPSSDRNHFLCIPYRATRMIVYHTVSDTESDVNTDAFLGSNSSGILRMTRGYRCISYNGYFYAPILNANNYDGAPDEAVQPTLVVLKIDQSDGSYEAILIDLSDIIPMLNGISAASINLNIYSLSVLSDGKIAAHITHSSQNYSVEPITIIALIDPDQVANETGNGVTLKFFRISESFGQAVADNVNNKYYVPSNSSKGSLFIEFDQPDITPTKRNINLPSPLEVNSSANIEKFKVGNDITFQGMPYNTIHWFAMYDSTRNEFIPVEFEHLPMSGYAGNAGTEILSGSNYLDLWIAEVPNNTYWRNRRIDYVSYNAPRYSKPAINPVSGRVVALPRKQRDHFLSDRFNAVPHVCITDGTGLDSTEFKWCIPVTNGDFVGIPDESTGGFWVLDGITDQFQSIGSVPAGQSYDGGQCAPNGLVYVAPSNGTQLAILDPENLSASFIDLSTQFPTLGNTENWISGTVGINGKLYFAPVNASSILEVDPSDNSVRMVGDFGAGTNKFSGITALPNGSLALIPAQANNPIVYFFPETERFEDGQIVPLDTLGAAISNGSMYINTKGWSYSFVLPIEKGNAEYAYSGLVNFG